MAQEEVLAEHHLSCRRPGPVVGRESTSPTVVSDWLHAPPCMIATPPLSF